jgi:putative membrane protein
MALKHLMAGVAAIGLMAQPALAQDSGAQQEPASQAEQQQLAQEDRDFATEAAEGGLKEVQLGELAQNQAGSPEVQQFGQRMVDDHGNANDKLMQIAEQKGIELPQEMSEKAQQTHDELEQKSGQAFDQAYMDEMVSDHEKDIEAFEQYVQAAQDPDLRAFAEQTLPTLREHLELAHQTQKVAAAAGEGDPQDAAMSGGSQQETMPDQQQAATQPEQMVSIEEVLGSSVVNASGDEVAEIEDLVIDQNQTHYAVLSVGGFLGIGEKKVVIPLDQLQLGEDQTYLMSGETEEQLEQMPEYQEDQFQPFQQRG